MSGALEWHNLKGNRPRPTGARVVHSIKSKRDVARPENRRVFVVMPEVKYEVASEHSFETAELAEGGFAYADTVEYTELCVQSGDVLDTGRLSIDGMLDKLLNLQSRDVKYKRVHGLVITANPAVLAYWLAPEFTVLYRHNNPYVDDGEPLGDARSNGAVVVGRVKPPVFEHNNITIVQQRTKRFTAKVDLWAITELTAHCLPIHGEDLQPSYAMIVDASSTWIKATVDAGLRDAKGRIERTPASQVGFAFRTRFYDQERDGVLVSPDIQEDFVATAKPRYLSAEMGMPQAIEYFSKLYHYDLKSAYLSILREPVPAIPRGMMRRQEIQDKGITLGWLREAYRDSGMVWVAEVKLPALEEVETDEEAGIVHVSKWVSNSTLADFDSLYEDSLVPVHVSLWQMLPVMRRLADSLIEARHNNPGAEAAVKAASVTAHMGIGYVGRDYIPISRRSPLYRYLLKHPEVVNWSAWQDIAFEEKAPQYLNRAKRKRRHGYVYGRKCPLVGEVFYEPVDHRVNNRVPHIGGWPLLICSARILNLVQAVNRSGGRVAWLHTDGLRTTEPIDARHMPMWLLDNPKLIGCTVERDMCLWPDGTRMSGDAIEAKPGSMPVARQGGKAKLLSRRFTGDKPVWRLVDFMDVVSAKSVEKERAMLLKHRKSLATVFGEAKARSSSDWVRGRYREGEHPVFNYRVLGLSPQQVEREYEEASGRLRSAEAEAQAKVDENARRRWLRKRAVELFGKDYHLLERVGHWSWDDEEQHIKRAEGCAAYQAQVALWVRKTAMFKAFAEAGYKEHEYEWLFKWRDRQHHVE